MPKERYIWVLSVVLATLVVTAAVRIDQAVTESVLEQYRHYTEHALSGASWQIRSSLTRAMDDLRALAHLPESRQSWTSDWMEHLRRDWAEVSAEIFLCGTDRELILMVSGQSESASEPCKRLSAAELDWASRGSSAGELKIQSEPSTDGGSLLRLLTPSYEIAKDETGIDDVRIRGVLVAEMNADSLFRRILQALCIMPSSQALLVRQNYVLSAYAKRYGAVLEMEEVLSRFASSHEDGDSSRVSRPGFAWMDWNLGEPAAVSWWPLQVGEEHWSLIEASPRSELLAMETQPGHLWASLGIVITILGGAAILVRSQRSRQRLITAVAREQARAREIGEQAWQSALLSEIVHDMRSTMEVSSIADTAVRSAGRALQASRSLFYLNEGPGSYRMGSQFTEEGTQELGIEDEPSLPLGLLVEGLASVVCVDNRHSASDSEVQNLVHRLNLSSFVMAPVPRARGHNGVIAFHVCERSRTWREPELRFIERLAAQVGTALDQAELYADQVRAAEARSGLLRAAHVLSSAREPSSVLDLAARLSLPLTGCRRSLIVVRVEGTEEWGVGALHGLESREAEALERIRFDPNVHAYLGEALRTRQAVSILTAARDERVPSDHARELALEAVYILPLLDGNEVLGLFLLERSQAHGALDDVELNVAWGIARHTASALKNARLFDALQASEARYYDLYDNSPDMYQTFDERGIILDCNRAHSRLLGFSKEEMVGAELADFLTTESAETWREILPRLFENGSVRDVSLNLSTKEGRIIDVSLNASVIRSLDDEVVAARGVLRDITELKQLEGQLRQSQKMELIGTLAGGVAHDFNNLLGGILGCASLLRTDLQEDVRQFPRAADYVDTIERSAKRGAELTSKLLTVARRSASRSEPVDLNQIVKDTAQLLVRTLNKNIRVEERLDPRLKLLLGDGSQVQQVVLNLCVNARDAMPDGGQMLVETEYMERDGKLRLSVQDTGMGIDTDALERIFEPFFTTKGRSGTGLGLSMVYAIVKSHGGEIRVVSSPGEGARFDVFFPAYQVEETVEDEESHEPQRGGGELILLVDDEEVLRNLGRDMLERFGYAVETAAGGEEALEIVRARRVEISLVILDFLMPGLDGAETCRRLRSAAPEVPIILASGLGQDHTIQKVLSEGASGFLAKPFSVADLIEAVSAALARQQSSSRPN